MTVADWIASRSSQVPEALRLRIMTVLGDAADDSQERTADACLAGATRLLEGLLGERRFDRSGAMDLLTVDALVTYACDHASACRSASELAAFARRGRGTISHLATARV